MIWKKINKLMKILEINKLINKKITNVNEIRNTDIYFV